VGTNYFLRLNECPGCGRYDELHIGKLSGGWEFGFQGYDVEDIPPIIFHGGHIRSWADWKDALSRGRIFDEYGREVSEEKFVQIVESSRGIWGPDGKPTQNHYDYCQQHYPSSIHPDLEWKDSEGWSFSLGEFS